MVLSEEQQGWSEIRTDDQVRHWQSAFVAIAPEAVREYASEVGPELLDKTAAARIAVSKYLRKLTPLSAESINAENVHGVLEKLFPDATEEHIESMNKVMKYPMIMIEDGKSLYETVVLAIVRFCDEVESQRNWLDMHPIAGRDRRLMVKDSAHGEPIGTRGRLAATKRLRSLNGAREKRSNDCLGMQIFHE
ncbi:MAG: hypothetical protein R3C02_03685 [Planctomycetaceae bacterium]